MLRTTSTGTVSSAVRDRMETVTTYIDTHVHLNVPDYDSDRELLIEQALEAGVSRMIVPASDLATSQSAVTLAQSWPCLRAAIGVHPHEADSFCPAVLASLRELAPQAVAIGEIGLDYHYNFHPHALQQEILTEQLLLAQELNLPVIIHVREADDDLLRILSQTSLPARGGVIHCCNSSWVYASRYLDLGLYLGFTGLVTYPKLVHVHEAAMKCPLDRLLTETDGPYLAPIPHRGKRCQPAWVSNVAQRIAELRGMELTTLTQAVFANAERLFGPL